MEHKYKYKYKKYKMKYLELKDKQSGGFLKKFLIKKGMTYIKNKITKQLILKCNTFSVKIYDQSITHITELFNNLKLIFINKIDSFLKKQYPEIVKSVDNEINIIYDKEIKNIISNLRNKKIKELCSSITTFIIDFLYEFIIIIYKNIDNDDKDINTTIIYNDISKLLNEKYRYLKLNIFNFQSIIINYIITSIIKKIKKTLNINDNINFKIDKELINSLKNKSLDKFIIDITDDKIINEIYQSLKSNLKDENILTSEIKISDIIDKEIISAIKNILTNDTINFEDIMRLIKKKLS
jgi:hypothetical protein